MCTDTEDTGKSGGMAAMAGMMEGCGCGGRMADMMAACLGSAADRQPPADEAPAAPDAAGPEGRTG